MTSHAWQLHQHTVCDRAGSPRRVSIALPVQRLHPLTVVYCANGQAVETLSQYMTACGVLSPPILVGVHSEESSRAQDYLYNDNDQYLAHEQFFVDELPVWANSEYDVPIARSTTVVFGFSNGGAFALTAALRHPTRFAAAFSFSTPKLPRLPHINNADPLMPSIYLACGTVGPEKAVRKNVLQLARWLRKKGVSTTLSERSAGHALNFWVSEFKCALEWFHESAA